jgi:hypothetical protein
MANYKEEEEKSCHYVFTVGDQCITSAFGDEPH